MKTKKFLMLLAAMLLSCTSAFAQNGNNTPVKGDVNEDGTVDVADIVAVIDIMKNGGGTATVGYLYLGTTKPTAANYKTLPGVVTSFASIDDAIGTKASVAAGQTIYMLCPAAWVKGKKVTLEDKSGNIVDFLDEKDETTISDYVIYKTQAWSGANDVTLKQEQEYYWYVGRQDTNGGSNAIGTADWETTNYDVFINSNDKQSTTSLEAIKTALTGSVSVGTKTTGKEDVVIIAPTSVINQITSIKNASDTLNVVWEKMNPSNEYTTVFIGDYSSTTLNIHF